MLEVAYCLDQTFTPFGCLPQREKNRKIHPLAILCIDFLFFSLLPDDPRSPIHTHTHTHIHTHTLVLRRTVCSSSSSAVAAINTFGVCLWELGAHDRERERVSEVSLLSIASQPDPNVLASSKASSTGECRGCDGREREK